MRSFLEYLENSIFKRILWSLENFVEGRRGLLQELGVNEQQALNHLIEPFKHLTFEGVDRPALEDLLSRIEKLGARLNSGQELYEALIDLLHMADNLDDNWHLRNRFNLISKVDRIRASRF